MPGGDPIAPMTHRRVLEAISGLLLAMFVAMLSSTVVSNALPRIVADLEGTEAGYTWVVVATLLSLTVTTPIWGKLADLFSKKLLVQVALLVFVVGSVLAGLAPNMELLIAARCVQGVGVGGLGALIQVVIASIVVPRERGRYFGYLGAVLAVATVSGPLVGGVIVDTSWLGWRWCFLVGIPFAVIASVVIQKTLRLPVEKRPVTIDYAGALLITTGTALLLVWVSLAGSRFAWASGVSLGLVAGGVVLLCAAVYVESRAREPVIPLHLFRDRTIGLAVLASAMAGIAIFGSTVFLAQYFQIARGMAPAAAGLMSLPLVVGLLVSSIGTGRLITTSGRWKRYLVGGSALVAVGICVLGTIDRDTSLVLIGGYLTVLGVGLGAVNQNLVLAAQNSSTHADVGVTSSLVTFFRMLGGCVGVSALGAAMGHQVSANAAAGLARLGLSPSAYDLREVPDLAGLPGPVRAAFEASYADATAHVFLLAAPFAVLALVGVTLIREKPLRTTLAEAEEVTSPRPATRGTRAGRRGPGWSAP